MEKLTIIKYKAKDGKIYDEEDKDLCIEHDKLLDEGGIVFGYNNIDEEKLMNYLKYGDYFLCNYEPGKLSIHQGHGCGGVGMIYGKLADKLHKQGIYTI